MSVKRSAIPLILGVVFFLAVDPVPAAPVVTYPFVGEIKTDRVNLRAGQSENFERLLYLKEGTKVTVVGKNYSWYEIRLPKDAKSFISADYVQKVRGDIAQVTGDRVNVRGGAGIHFTVLAQLNEGDTVRLKEKRGDWYLVEPIPDSTGWVFEDFIVYKSEYTDDTVKEEAPGQAMSESSGVPDPEPKPEPLVKQEEGVTPSVKEPPPARTDTAQVEDKASMPEEDPSAKAPEPALDRGAVVTVVGHLKSLKEESPRPGIPYQLIVDGDTAYYLRGHKGIMDGFRHHKVKISGTVQHDSSDVPSGQPVLVVAKISLVL